MKEKCLAYLSSASEEDLLRLCAQLRNWKRFEANEYDELSRQPSVAPAPKPTQRAWVEPPGEACKRIGAETQEEILKRLPATLDELCVAMTRKTEDMRSLLKLLWARKIVKFDGEKYESY